MSSVPLQQALRHLQAAFANFITGRANHPAFKSRERSRASAEYTRSAFRWRNGRLFLARMDGPLDIVWSRPLPEGAEPSTVTESRDSAGRWFVSILVEEKIRPPAPAGSAVGVDAGIAALAALSTGKKIVDPRHERRDRRRLARAQRDLSRKAPGSVNRDKARRRVARICARITDWRRDFLHKVTTRLRQYSAVSSVPLPSSVARLRVIGAITRRFHLESLPVPAHLPGRLGTMSSRTRQTKFDWRCGYGPRYCLYNREP